MDEPEPILSEMNTPLPLPAEDDEIFTWDDSYAIARALNNAHPEIDLEQVSLGMIYNWTVELPGFGDDPAMANEAILSAIYQEWFEEANPL